MKIAILGTKGIPNNYGGYEQFAEFISQRLVKRGHQVTVYNPSFHAYREPAYKGVSVIRQYSPEKWIGGSANFIYDFLCLKDALGRDFDIVYEAGYHSVAPAYRVLGIRSKKKPVVVTNMDGLEYNRSKWSWFTQQLIRKLEKIAVRDSPFMISDNLGIQEYYRDQFNRDSFFLSYGADPVTAVDENHLGRYGVMRHGYLMLVARFEPENNLEMALEGFLMSGVSHPFLVVGNHQTRYGRYLKSTFPDPRIRFVGGIYDKPVLDSLRHFAAAYVHGHSVGGTNPSLLEAMACGSFIFAHDNPFNRKVLFDSAFYFGNSGHVKELLSDLAQMRSRYAQTFADQNVWRIEKEYNWERVVDQHESLFRQLLEMSANHKQND
jgi:glycosyltransferase involved in cell wall biosynthesis